MDYAKGQFLCSNIVNFRSPKVKNFFAKLCPLDAAMLELPRLGNSPGNWRSGRDSHRRGVMLACATRAKINRAPGNGARLSFRKRGVMLARANRTIAIARAEQTFRRGVIRQGRKPSARKSLYSPQKACFSLSAIPTYIGGQTLCHGRHRRSDKGNYRWVPSSYVTLAPPKASFPKAFSTKVWSSTPVIGVGTGYDTVGEFPRCTI